MNRPVHSLEKISKNLRATREWKKVVLAGGTFDIIHPGHLNYLARCKAEGDILVVYVAGDARTNRRKGALRPLLPASQRARIVSNLKMVDLAFTSNSKPFSEDILRQINPDVIVTSSNEPSQKIKLDFKREMAQRYPNIKVVLIRRPNISWSSSSLIQQLTERLQRQSGRET